MLRRVLPIFALLGLLSAGCVPVSEPVGDISKAEPNAKLIGKCKASEKEQFVVYQPKVKGNPKGLMRATAHPKDKPEPNDSLWFFTTTVAKHTYANMAMTKHKDKDEVMFADFSTEGAYEKWAKGEERWYWVVLLEIEEDKVTLHEADAKAMAKVMKEEKIEEVKYRFKTPAGWFAKYLEKNGPGALYAGGEKVLYNRVKE